MTINTNLLICPTVFQDFLVDKSGNPMAGGTITCYQDTQRTILKNWYYQTGVPGSYTYIALPNPLTLSASGTVCDINGNDVLPMFYPYSELDSSQQQAYYITIVSYDQLTQITRSNFPFLATSSSANIANAAQENYIINNVFWRNIGATTLSSVTNKTIAPSQHDGFRYPDVQFFKSNTGATDLLTFPQFTGQTSLVGDPTPQYYLNHVCTNASSESYKYYQFPLSYQIATLSGQECTVSFQAKSTSSGTSLNNTVSLYVFQDLGTGAAKEPIFVKSFLITQTWTKFTWTFTLPSSALETVSATGDNALYLQLWLPVNATFDISFTKLSLYLATSAPTNNFSTYDQIDPIINGFRTGDIRTSLNAFSPMGWVPANDGTISYNATESLGCYGASTAELTGYVYNNGSSGVGATLTAGANGVFLQDGLTVPLNSRWLYKNSTTTTAYNGVYVLTDAGSNSSPAVLTRATDFNTAPLINSSGVINVQNGTANENTYWLQTATVTTVGTSPVMFNATTYITRANVDTWPLYNLLWSFVSQTYAPVAGGRGASAYADFTANKPLTLTRTLSRLLGTAGAGAGLSTWELGQYNGSESQELPAHNHTIATTRGNGTDSSAAYPGGGQAPAGSFNTGNTGTGANPINILPPAVYYNVFFKL